MKYSLTTVIDCKNRYLKLFEMLDKADVPPETRWRSLLLFFREIGDYNCLSDVQKITIQALMAKILSKKDYSDIQLDSTLKDYHEIVTKPYKTQVESLVQEAAGAVNGFRKMLSTRYGDIVNLEEESIAIVSDFDDSESILKLRNAFARVKTLIEDDIRNLEDIAFMDGITKITNRRGFDKFMSVALDRWQQHDRPLHLSILDIDHFKRFNDEHGHRIGDQVLTVVGAHLKKALTAFDDSNDALAARYGGEEFVLVVSGPDASRLANVTKRCCEMIKNFNFLIRDAHGNVVESGLHITMSAGVASACKQWRGAYLENLIDNADRAMYHAKKSGRDATYEFKLDEEPPFTLITV